MTRSAPLLLVVLLAASGTHAAPPRALRYRSMSFRDFVVDGLTLAKKSTPVELTGVYTRQGEVAVLYENQNALIMERVGPGEAGSTPTIPLLTDAASHRFREMQYSCDSQQSYGTLGCILVVRGIATMCSLTNAFGAETDSPCIEVQDGDDGATSSVSPASASDAPPAAAAPPDNPSDAFDQKVRNCISSPEMADVGDAYRKCVKRVRAESAAGSPPAG